MDSPRVGEKGSSFPPKFLKFRGSEYWKNTLKRSENEGLLVVFKSIKDSFPSPGVYQNNPLHKKTDKEKKRM